MYHFFVEPGQVHDNYVEILGGDVNHMKNVLRMKPGEEIIISDGFGHEYSCNVSELTEDSVRAEILERREVSVELPSRLVLFQCLPKGDKMELIVELIDRVLHDPENEANIAAIRKEVNALMSQYPLFAW